jgi:hypothetical protein
LGFESLKRHHNNRYHMKFDATERGFTIAEFEDLYGEKCSLQKSSAAMYDAIWLGVSQPEPVILHEGQWKKIELPEGTLLNGRMHLSQKMVRDLLPALQHFAEHGELPEE